MTLRRLRGLFAAQGIALGLLMPFLVPLLDERGLGAAEMGLALGVAGVASLVAYPVWGAIADGPLGRQRAIALTSATAAAGGLLLLVAGRDPLVLTAALALATVGALPWGPLIDALALRELAEPADTYGRVRAWASVGWAGAAIAAGVAWLAVGSVLVIVAFSIAATCLAGLVLWPRPRPLAALPGPTMRPPQVASARQAGQRSAGSTSGRSGVGTPGPREPGDAAGTSTLLRQVLAAASPMLVGFLLGVFVTSIGEHAAARFVSLRILDQGGAVLLVGIAAALPAIIEIPVFGGSRSLLALLGLRRMYVGGALIAAILAALVALAPEAWMVTLLRTVDGTSYALRYMAMVVIVGALLPGHLHALGQSLTWFVYAGVAPIIGDVAGGLIYDRFGAPALFASAMLMLLVGGSIAWLALRGPRFARGASGADIPLEAAAPALPPS